MDKLMDSPETFAARVLNMPEQVEDIETANEIYVRFADLGRAYGFNYRCSKGHNHVIINDSRSPVQQKITYFHETHHCLIVVPASTAEAEAERYARTVSAKRGIRE